MSKNAASEETQLLACLCDAPKMKTAGPPKSYGAHGTEYGAGVSWDSIFPAILKMLTVLRLPYIKPSLVTLREKINGYNWFYFFKAPLLAALDVLINDPELFKTVAAANGGA